MLYEYSRWGSKALTVWAHSELLLLFSTPETASIYLSSSQLLETGRRQKKASHTLKGVKKEMEGELLRRISPIPSFQPPFVATL